MINGVIVLDKPKGKTSHDMVNVCRRLFSMKRVGHTGTLDPNATGVLPICLGNATKAADYIASGKKRYIAQIIFGKATDSQDCTGSVTEISDKKITADMLEDAASHFTGQITQVPPMYSAVKVNGKKLYEYARKGESVERKEREISVYSADIVSFDFEAQTAMIDVQCSKGTYIRTLCDDIGRYAGTFAHMGDLRRIGSGIFKEEDCHTAEEIEKAVLSGTADSLIIKTENIFEDYGKIYLNADETFKAVNGAAIEKEGIPEGKKYRVFDFDGNFICVSQCENGVLKMKTAFWSR